MRYYVLIHEDYYVHDAKTPKDRVAVYEKTTDTEAEGAAHVAYGQAQLNANVRHAYVRAYNTSGGVYFDKPWDNMTPPEPEPETIPEEQPQAE